jgi:outer membrane lipoprotein SlyB
MNVNTWALALSAALLLTAAPDAVVRAQSAQQGATKQPGTLPPSTNPTNRVIYPSEGQDEQQQMTDQLECYRWSTEQTQWDPYVAYEKLVEQGYAAKQTAQQAQGGLVRGAARGALAGVAIGAIAGDAGKGAAIGAVAGGLVGGSRSRRAQRQAQAQAEAAISAFEQQLQVWDRNYVACMQGRHYVVN